MSTVACKQREHSRVAGSIEKMLSSRRSRACSCFVSDLWGKHQSVLFFREGVKCFRWRWCAKRTMMRCLMSMWRLRANVLGLGWTDCLTRNICNDRFNRYAMLVSRAYCFILENKPITLTLFLQSVVTLRTKGFYCSRIWDACRLNKYIFSTLVFTADSLPQRLIHSSD